MYHANQNIKVTLAFIYYEYLLNEWMHDKWDRTRSISPWRSCAFPPPQEILVSNPAITLSVHRILTLLPHSSSCHGSCRDFFMHWSSSFLNDPWVWGSSLMPVSMPGDPEQIADQNLEHEAMRWAWHSLLECCERSTPQLMCGASKAVHVKGPKTPFQNQKNSEIKPGLCLLWNVCL